MKIFLLALLSFITTQSSAQSAEEKVSYPELIQIISTLNKNNIQFFTPDLDALISKEFLEVKESNETEMSYHLTNILIPKLCVGERCRVELLGATSLFFYNKENVNEEEEKQNHYHFCQVVHENYIRQKEFFNSEEGLERKKKIMMDTKSAIDKAIVIESNRSLSNPNDIAKKFIEKSRYLALKNTLQEIHNISIEAGQDSLVIPVVGYYSENYHAMRFLDCSTLEFTNWKTPEEMFFVIKKELLPVLSM